MAASQETQHQKRATHGGHQGCYERRQELFKDELQGKKSQPFKERSAQRVQGTTQSHQGPNPGSQKGEEETLHETAHSEGSSYSQGVAMCQLCAEKLDDTQGVSPVPHHPPMSLKPNATPGDGIGFHGEPSHVVGQRGRTQSGQRATKNCFAGEQSYAFQGDPRQGRGYEPSGLPDNPLRKGYCCPLGRQHAQGQPQTQMLALKVTLPPETRPGVRVDQATARLARVQKLKVELEEKLFEVEAAVQDNLKEIAAATAELENVKKLHGFLLSCQKSMANDPEGKERAKRGCAEGHEATGVTQEAAQEEFDAAHKLPGCR